MQGWHNLWISWVNGWISGDGPVDRPPALSLCLKVINRSPGLINKKGGVVKGGNGVVDGLLDRPKGSCEPVNVLITVVRLSIYPGKN